MESNRRRRRRRDKPKAPKQQVASPTTEEAPTVHDVPDHVLELILLRLDSSVCLVRAASACKRWRRVVADAEFLGRFRLLRMPVVLGHYGYRLANGSRAPDGDPVFVPSSTPSIHRRQSFSLDFVPKIDGHWEVADSRDGLLLLLKKDGKQVQSRRFNPDLVVCEPLTRRYEAISCPPDMLSGGGRPYLGLFLLDGGATGRSGCGRGIGMSNFKDMAVWIRDHTMVSGRRANGSLYWGIFHFYGAASPTALVLDEATARVSQVALPVRIQQLYQARCFRVIGREDGTLRAVRLEGNKLRVYAWLHGGDEWMLENLVGLPKNTSWNLTRAMIVAAHETYVVVAPQHRMWLFSVDLKG
ncbi:hypothetical protein BAE44_0000049 [Dichanthelium oligosanthes]|uniref:F-box domain-containing protein n=1 Tax=Dichanthelium oligosanthes TaxID=888268 RepID=A0A1E5WNF3_9POAL|nr:hypothetical protein BAE44_0000049 [Dichanthelium oligosanthes]